MLVSLYAQKRGRPPKRKQQQDESVDDVETTTVKEKPKRTRRPRSKSVKQEGTKSFGQLWDAFSKEVM